MKKQYETNPMILIFEPCADGHHGPYLRWMATGLVERGLEVTIITLPETMKHPAMLELMNIAHESNGSLQIVPTSSPIMLPLGSAGSTAGLIARELAYWRLFRAWYKFHSIRVQPDIVFIPYLDYCLYAFGLLGSPFGISPWVGLSMRPSFHYQSMGVLAPQPALSNIKNYLFFRAYHNHYLRQLLTTDEPLVNFLKERRRVSGKVTFFPEPAELNMLPDSKASKQTFGVMPKRKLILLYGAIAARKGVLDLLRALACQSFPRDVDVLLAGKITEQSIKHILAETWAKKLIADGRLRIVDRFIQSTEEPILFAAADIVWIGYRQHFNSSGILAQAASAGRSILACKEGVIGWQVRHHKLGKAINIENTDDIINAINDLLNEQSQITSDGNCLYSWRPPSFSEAQDTLAQALGPT